MSDTEFFEIWQRENKTPFDYPSNYQMIYGNLDRLAPLVKRVFDFVPMSVTARKELNS